MRIVPFLALLAACSRSTLLPADDRAIVEVGPQGACEPSVSVLAPDDVVPDGFTARSVAEGVGGERMITLKYDDTGAVTDLLVEVIANGEARWVDETWVADPASAGGADTAEEPGCLDRLEIDGALVFSSADGAFDEEIPVVIVGNELGGGRIDVEVAYADLRGDYVPTEIDPAEWGSIRLEWAVNASPEGVSGEVALYADRTGDDFDEGYANDMARFPAP